MAEKKKITYVDTTGIKADNGATTRDDYIHRAESNPSGTSATDDYYQLARDQEYSTLFDKEVALENAKSNALKYTNNQINAMGFGGTGYGSSMQSGIYNTYLNRVGDARSEYNTNIKEIAQQEKEAMEVESAQRTGNVTGMLQSSTSQEQMDELLADYGYGTYENGQFVWGEKPDNMSDDEWKQMRYYYRAMSQAFEEADNNVYIRDLALATTVLKDQDGNTGSFNDELNYMFNNKQFAEKVKPVDGDVIKISQNSDGGTKYAYMIYRNGAWQQCNASTYSKSNTRYWLRSQKNSNSVFYIDKNGKRI